MKMLFITPRFPPDAGGAAHVFGSLSKKFSENHSITILTSTQKGFMKTEQSGTMKIYRLFPYYQKWYEKVLMLPFSLIRVFVFFLLNFRKFDVVESHTVGELCLLGQYNAKLFRKPLVKHVIDMQTPRFLLKNPRPELFVCCGDCIKQKIMESGINQKTYVIHLPMHKIITKKTKNGGKFRFVFIGELSKSKGVLDLLSVLEKMRGDFEFIFVGDGPLLEELRKRSENDSRIVVTGRIRKEDIHKLLMTTDVLVHPSYSDVMPISILEAMAHGNVIIASDVGEIKKVVSGAGLFIKPGDSDTLSKYMNYALAHDIKKLKKKAVENFSIYTKDDIYKQNLDALERAIEIKRSNNKNNSNSL